MMCRILDVSRSGFYDWRRRLTGPPSPRAAQDRVLLDQITALHTQLGSYGSPRIHRELIRANVQVGRHRVARLMRENGIVATRGKRKARPRAAPPVRRPEVKDLVHRIFDRPRPNMLWFTDLTMIKTGQGYLRAAVIMDAHSRRVISWATADHETPNTAYTALRDAIALRKPPPQCIVHSDRGYQFTSETWLTIIKDADMMPSIGQQHSALDNAAMESWFGSFKNEALHPYPQPKTCQEARQILLNYINFYNT
ncbi:IS3 family transposase, partial [Amycolatopsis sp. NPDC059021]|uniref:IS3 family transposase n=1 Tax=Amycolatopsis sp. NPDC059021 TaxID=3346704 RepID=UPI00366FE666